MMVLVTQFLVLVAFNRWHYMYWQQAIIKWMDNRPVLLMSNQDGCVPVNENFRWSKKVGQWIKVPHPFAVKAYNMNMDGVDFLDCVISSYPD